MIEYTKIETLLDRDEKTFGVIEGRWRLPEFEYLANNQWMWTEKVDGTNVRVMWDGQDVRFGGRTDNAQMPTFLLQKLQERFSVVRLAAAYAGKPMCLYGEGFGARIQKGGGNYIPNGVDFVLFDVLVGEWWLQRLDVASVASVLDVPVIPVVSVGTLFEVVRMVKRGFNSKWGDFSAEGLVVKPTIELRNRAGDRLIGKLKQKDFK